MVYIPSFFCMRIIREKNSKSAGVATIVATLLTISITVVGGIIVYAFVQEFYSESQIDPPSIESLEIYGYDATNLELLQTHSGKLIGINNVQKDSELSDGDAIILYIRNYSANIIIIQEVKVYGSSYFIDPGLTCSEIIPVTGKFSLSVSGDENCLGIGYIKPHQEFSIYLRYDELSNGKVSLGKTIPVTIISGEGTSITKHLKNGIQVG